jgi:hypothetical protein
MANRNSCRYIDQDYLSKLSDSDLEWIKSFNKEYYFGDITELQLIENKREGFTRRNRERRDASVKAFYIDVDYSVKSYNIEDAIIDILDNHAKLQRK